MKHRVALETYSENPTFSQQLDNKVLHTNHAQDVSVSYATTYTLKYVLKGEKHYKTEGKYCRVAENQLLLLNPHEKLSTQAKEGTQGLSLFLSSELMREVFAFHAPNGSPRPLLEVVQRKSSSPIAGIVDAIFRQSRASTALDKASLHKLFVLLSEQIVAEQLSRLDIFTALHIQKHTTREALLQQVLQAKEYLQDMLDHPISLADLGRDLGLSKYYLHRLFGAFEGQTPMEYLRDLRLKNAKKLLQRTSWTVADIAQRCGYESTAYFSNCFKRAVGLSPSQYRQQG